MASMAGKVIWLGTGWISAETQDSAALAADCHHLGYRRVDPGQLPAEKPLRISWSLLGCVLLATLSTSGY